MRKDEVAPEEDGEPFISLSATRGGLLASAALTGVVLYALVERGPLEFIRSAALVSIPFFLAAGIGGIVAWLRGKRSWPTWLHVRQAGAVVAVVGVVGGAVYYGLYVTGLSLLRWLQGGTFRPGTGSAAVVAILAGLAGLTLFWFRLRMRALYGLSEVAAGLSIAAWRGFNQAGAGVPGSAEFYVAILTASIYLVVRGLDNVYQGLQGRDLSVALLRRFLDGGGVTVTVRRLK